MPDTTPPKSRVIDATHLVDALTFRTGISAKSGNPYIIGSIKIKTRSGRPYTFDLGYIDENGQIQIEDALEHFANQDKSDFTEGLQD